MDRRLVPAVAGLVGIGTWVVVCDVWAVRSRPQRPTISAFVAELLDHSVGGPVVIGGLSAAGWHLAVEPVISKLLAAHKHNVEAITEGLLEILDDLAR